MKALYRFLQDPSQTSHQQPAVWGALSKENYDWYWYWYQYWYWYGTSTSTGNVLVLVFSDL
jgi:hypothetical protein